MGRRNIFLSMFKVRAPEKAIKTISGKLLPVGIPLYGASLRFYVTFLYYIHNGTGINILNIP